MAILQSPPALLPSPDPGGIGTSDELGNGLVSCTETLGFESSNEIWKATDAAAEFQFQFDSCVSENHETTPAKSKKSESKKRFPPPLSSLNPDGKRIFFLCPVRCQGRLELTEVKIERTEFLHASREDGRLRLDLVETEDESELEDDDDENEEEEYHIEEEIEGDDEDNRNWLLPEVIFGGGDGGLRRCNEVVHRQDLQGWGPRCVISL